MRALFLITMMLAGCSALVDGDTQQCKVDADCSGLAGTMCSAGLCTDVVAGEQNTPGCTKHSECTNALGKAGYCRADGTCKELFTPECDNVLPENAEMADDMHLVGFMGIVKGEEGSYGRPQLQGAQLALEEIQNQLIKLPGAMVSDSKRNLAVLVCNHSEADKGVPAIAHLVNDLEVSAIVGASYSGVTMAAHDSAAAKGILVFSPAATSPAVTTYEERVGTDLLFRTVPSDVLQAGALKKLVLEVTKTLRASGRLAENAAPVIAMPTKDDPAGKGLFASAIMSPDFVSGTQLLYDPTAVANDAVYREQQAKKLVDLKPDIVLHLGTGEYVQYVMPLIEQTWPNAARPWYLVPEGDLEKLAEMGSEGMITSNAIAARLVGTTPGGRRSEAFRIFAANFPGGKPGNLAEFAYDAVYMLAYAIAASNKQRPTGVELAGGLRKLGCMNGPAIRGGFGDFNAGWRAASAGCMDYAGPGGDMNFDQYGDVQTDVSVGCLQKAGAKYEFVRLDTYYAIKDQALVPYKSPLLDLSKSGWCTPLVP